MRNSLITGANRGIGLEYVRQLLQGEGRVFAACRNPEAADALQDLQKQFPEQLTILQLDVRDEASIQAAAERVGESVDALDLLVNNAAIYTHNEQLGQLSAESMLAGLHTNSVAPMLVAQAFENLLRKGQNAKIINISSGLGSIAGAGAGSHTYRASKAALNMYSAVLASELRGAGIIVIAMHPGWVQTDMGGRGAHLQVEESVRGQLKVIEGLGMRDSGRFLQWDGQELAW